MNLRHSAFVAVVALLLAGCGGDDGAAVVPVPDDAPRCVLDAGPIEFSGTVGGGDAKTYAIKPFVVPAGTQRIELSYGWSESGVLPSTPLTATTLDLGLWDNHGYRSAEGFRGWSGSRQGRLDADHGPVYIEAGQAERGYFPGAIEAGVWYAELGIAAVSPTGAGWTLKVECKSAGTTVTPAADPVDATHVARSGPGWYHGDFHMHAYHSNPNAPDWDAFIAQARAVQLDFLMVTEYVTGAHWRTLGAVQRANPDLLIWPGREIITYFGHATTHGETPQVLEYRHGFEDVNLGDIQRAAKAAGALFQVNHPTSFPGPVFANFCRGCEFTLGDEIDWGAVDTMEILNGPVMATAGDLGIPIPALQIENPFMTTALLLWDQQFKAGHRITGVSGSDSKGVEPDDAERARRGYGNSVTAVYAENLSRPALTAAIKAGHAYVRTRGVAHSPALELRATAPDGSSGIFGDTLTLADGGSATLKVTVTGGQGQVLNYLRNGLIVQAVPITADPFTHSRAISRLRLNEGPLGTAWRVETRDLSSRTTIGNPVFLKSP